MLKNNKGFSLLELIVVILIMGVLAAIIVPSVSAMVEKSRMAADEQTAATIAKAAMLVYAEESVKSTSSVWAAPNSGKYNAYDASSTTNEFAIATRALVQKTDQIQIRSKTYGAGTNEFVIYVDAGGDTIIRYGTSTGVNVDKPTTEILWPKP